MKLLEFTDVMSDLKTNLTGDEQATVNRFRHLSTRMTSEKTMFLGRPDTHTKLVKALSSWDTAVPSGRTESGCVTLVVFDTKCVGEAQTNPSTRKPGVQVVDLEDIMASVLEARGGGRELLPNDVYLFLDGGKQRDARIKKLFRFDDIAAETGRISQKAIPHKTRELTLFYDSEQMEYDMQRVGGFGSLKVKEKAIFISRDAIKVPVTTRHNLGGSSVANVWGPLMWKSESDESCWKQTLAFKKLLFGSRRTRPGGKDPSHVDKDSESSSDEECAKPRCIRKDEDIEPVFYHQAGPAFFDDIVRIFKPSQLICLTASDATIAQDNIQSKKTPKINATDC